MQAARRYPEMSFKVVKEVHSNRPERDRQRCWEEVKAKENRNQTENKTKQKLLKV